MSDAHDPNLLVPHEKREAIKLVLYGLLWVVGTCWLYSPELHDSMKDLASIRHGGPVRAAGSATMLEWLLRNIICGGIILCLTAFPGVFLLVQGARGLISAARMVVPPTPPQPPVPMHQLNTIAAATWRTIADRPTRKLDAAEKLESMPLNIFADDPAAQADFDDARRRLKQKLASGAHLWKPDQDSYDPQWFESVRQEIKRQLANGKLPDAEFAGAGAYLALETDWQVSEWRKRMTDDLGAEVECYLDLTWAAINALRNEPLP